MRRVLVCLGFLALWAAYSSAQNAPPEAPNPDSQAAARTSSSAAPAGAAQDQAGKHVDKEPADHKTHVHLGGVAIAAGYAHFSPGIYPYAFYDPFYYPFSPVYAAMLWDPFWEMYPAGYFSSGTDKGEVKLVGVPKDAAVYIDGAYAGTADHLKSMWLDPGAYDLAVTLNNGRRFDQRVYVLTGKSLKISATFREQPKEEAKP